VELFAARVADYRATVTHCAAAEIAETIRAALGDAHRVVAPDDLPYPVDDALTDDFSPSELDTVDTVVTAVAVGIAVTGSIRSARRPGSAARRPPATSS